ncbi:filamentous hemagglutinin family protein [Hydrogenophaga laconesensis]|uniref:Filamentous hemagglutinin family protein n=1 Tax=Hydrogenophaga laconesensis TaxID=1805971 RepID=A0ABU1VFX7_9BURK|nr:filamentous hemagglutinin N-terminal domain-containing protein [Hydrogenophaga laconesensis]MDR7096218.1 filamentous hemagglutinin family protein [Hydrogenophaga laconesensis]
MNRNRHRVVFNAARGQRMVVAENASSASGETPAAPDSVLSPLAPLGDLDICKASLLRNVALHPLTLSIGLAFTLGAVFYTTAHAQIVADPNAPANQRPIVLQTGNGIPLVQIRTPSAAGVSRNTYGQFDIQSNGAVLNNVRSNAAQTQIGGFVQANPFLSTGAARVILNEVNSSNPSYLNGPLEVAGQRAEVIVANPAGIRVNGGTFLNAAGVTLTTGTPVIRSGHLDAFLVGGGTVHIEGLGLDTRTADSTTILARAVEVNAGLWAEQLKVVTGANEVSADASTVTSTPASAQGAAPQFALDVAAIGGMYAGKIHLIGTEAGLGINNAGRMSASSGDFVLQADGWLRNTGSVQAQGNLAIQTTGAISNTGAHAVVSAQGDATVSTGSTLANSGGAAVVALGNLGVSAPVVNNTGGTRLQAVRDVRLSTVTTAVQENSVRDESNYLKGGRSEEVGSQVRGAGNVSIVAGGSVVARAANVQADKALSAQAGGDITIEAGEASSNHALGYKTESGGLLGKRSTTVRTSEESTIAVESSLGGREVSLQAGQNVTVRGSSVVSDQGTALVAGEQISIEAGENRYSQSQFREDRKSGIFTSGASITLGSQQKSTQQEFEQTTAAASTVGAITGDVTLIAGGSYRQAGSDVLAPGGDVTVLARDIAITETQETQHSRTEEKFRQGGLSLSLGGAAISVAQGMASTAKAVGETKSERMQALGAATLALQGSQLIDEVGKFANAADPAAAVNISISIGGSKSESRSESYASNARGSAVVAGDSVNLVAAGAGEQSVLLIQGSDVSAGDAARLTLNAGKPCSTTPMRWKTPGRKAAKAASGCTPWLPSPVVVWVLQWAPPPARRSFRNWVRPLASWTCPSKPSRRSRKWPPWAWARPWAEQLARPARRTPPARTTLRRGRTWNATAPWPNAASTPTAARARKPPSSMCWTLSATRRWPRSPRPATTATPPRARTSTAPSTSSPRKAKPR